MRSGGKGDAIPLHALFKMPRLLRRGVSLLSIFKSFEVIPMKDYRPIIGIGPEIVMAALREPAVYKACRPFVIQVGSRGRGVHYVLAKNGDVIGTLGT